MISHPFARPFPIRRVFATTAVLLTALTGVLSAVADDAAPSATRKVTAGDLHLSVPMRWQTQETKSQFRVAQFGIPAAKGDPADGDLVVYFFGAGGAGGVDANVKRWVGQFESEGRKVKVVEGKSAQGKYTLVDISGSYNKPVGPPIQMKSKRMEGWRLLGVILESPKGSYFLKFDGPAATVKAAEEEFRAAFGGNAKDEKAVER